MTLSTCIATSRSCRRVLATSDIIGLTVVAAGTSVPELAVSAIAAIQGKNDIAVANVVGSNIFNITVILGIQGAGFSFGIVVDKKLWDCPWVLQTGQARLGAHLGARREAPEAL